MTIQLEDQYQIGDLVIYEQEGVCTRVSGYKWMESIDLHPRIIGYELDCGVTVPYTALRRATDADLGVPPRPQERYPYG